MAVRRTAMKSRIRLTVIRTSSSRQTVSFDWPLNSTRTPANGMLVCGGVCLAAGQGTIPQHGTVIHGRFAYITRNSGATTPLTT